MSHHQQQELAFQIKIEDNQCDLCYARVPNPEMLADHKATVHGQVRSLE